MRCINTKQCPPPDSLPILSGDSFPSSERILIWGLFLLLFCGPVVSFSHTHQATEGTRASVVNELQRRLEAAMEARKSGDPAAIGPASKRVIALDLVEMARFRLDENLPGRQRALSQ